MFKAIGLSVLAVVMMGSVCFAQTADSTNAMMNQEQTSDAPKTHSHSKKSRTHKKSHKHNASAKKPKKTEDQQ